MIKAEEPMVEAAVPELSTCFLKAPPLLLEKRKPEGSDWKCLKKIDCQRLETVLEEVQVLGEAMSSKCVTKPGEQIRDGGHGRGRKSWSFKPMSITEHPELLLKGGHLEEEKMQQEQVLKDLANDRVEKGVVLETHDDHSPSSSTEAILQDKRGLFNGMMEILPIFSNHDFAFSRDALSITESDELEALERPPCSGRLPLESRDPKNKAGPFHSLKRCFRERLTEKLGDLKHALESNCLSKDCSFASNKTIFPSSYFINFLLVLTPFSEERERMLNKMRLEDEKLVGKISQDDDSLGHPSRGDQKYENAGLSPAQNVFAGILIVLGIFFFFLTLAWRSYQPPGFMFHVLNCIPFMHCRRTYIQTFFDKLTAFAKSLR